MSSIRTSARSPCPAGKQRRRTNRPVPAMPPMSREELVYYVRHNLSREERLVIMLRYAEELRFEEIAGILTMSEPDVQALHDQVVERLRGVLGVEQAAEAICETANA